MSVKHAGTSGLPLGAHIKTSHVTAIFALNELRPRTRIVFALNEPGADVKYVHHVDQTICTGMCCNDMWIEVVW